MPSKMLLLGKWKWCIEGLTLNVDNFNSLFGCWYQMVVKRIICSVFIFMKCPCHSHHNEKLIIKKLFYSQFFITTYSASPNGNALEWILLINEMVEEEQAWPLNLSRDFPTKITLNFPYINHQTGVVCSLESHIQDYT